MLLQTPILTVTQLNKHVKNVLEYDIGTVHVEGEVSNLSKPSSGHYYFTLKDNAAQIRCVFFKNRHTPMLKNTLTDGQRIVARGTLSLYEARGDYQLIVEHITEAGMGALYQQFEALKKKLQAEGLFDASRKKPLPAIPQSIGVITSNSGAAIRDILSTLARRFPLADVSIYPCEVQGATASLQIIKALTQANQEQRCDVLIVARGGGSIEDLWAFNDEALARCIASSDLPIISGVGHETDFTIADFVADYRAETPTAAACAATPDAAELVNMLSHIKNRLQTAMTRTLHAQNMRLNHLMEKTASPKQAIRTYWQTLDYLERQLVTSINHSVMQKKQSTLLCTTLLHAQNPITKITQTQARVRQVSEQLQHSIRSYLDKCTQHMTAFLTTLHAVSPLATLDRGYAIATHADTILFNTQQVRIGDKIEVRLAQGSLACAVTDIQE